MVSAQSLSYTYPSGESLTFEDLNCPSGKDLLILGNSGTGKTTLLHLLAGLLDPERGDVLVNGFSMGKSRPGDRDQFRGRNIGMIFQQNFFIRGLNVLENLMLARRISGAGPDNVWLQRLMEKLEIDNLAGKKPYQLSQGQQQRFSIARALANKPSVVLADEPTSSLDDDNCARFVELMRIPYSQEPVSWIIASHDSRLKPGFENIYSIT